MERDQSGKKADESAYKPSLYPKGDVDRLSNECLTAEEAEALRILKTIRVGPVHSSTCMDTDAPIQQSSTLEEVRQVLSQYADCTLAKELGGVPFFYEAKLLSRDAGQVVSTEVVGGSASNKKQLRGGGGLVYGEKISVSDPLKRVKQHSDDTVRPVLADGKLFLLPSGNNLDVRTAQECSFASEVTACSSSEKPNHPPATADLLHHLQKFLGPDEYNKFLMYYESMPRTAIETESLPEATETARRLIFAKTTVEAPSPICSALTTRSAASPVMRTAQTTHSLPESAVVEASGCGRFMLDADLVTAEDDLSEDDLRTANAYASLTDVCRRPAL